MAVTASSAGNLSRSQLEAARTEWLIRGTRTKADLWLSRTPQGETVVVKDFIGKPAWIRWWGRVQISREARFLRRLEPLGVAPKLVARLDRFAIVMQHLPGKAAFLCRHRPQSQRYFVDLAAHLQEIHALGIVHNDLRGRENVQISKLDDRVWILDWAAAVALPVGSWRHRLLFPAWSRIDRAALLKWKQVLAPDLITAADLEELRRFQRWRRLWPLNRKGVGGEMMHS